LLYTTYSPVPKVFPEPKTEFAEYLQKKLKKSKEEILNALPTGGFKEIKCRE